MKNRPIMVFESQKQAEDCLAEWQERLFLKSWLIKVILLSPEEMRERGAEDLAGQNETQFVNQMSVIRITNLAADKRQFHFRACAEKTLVHELLHCKYNILVCNDSYEGKILDVQQHILLEQMAKSLIMAKYNLPFSWFQGEYENE